MTGPWAGTLSTLKTEQPHQMFPLSHTLRESEELIMNNNRVYCLYRVSTDKQVDYSAEHEADIPMHLLITVHKWIAIAPRKIMRAAIFFYILTIFLLHFF